MSRQLVVTCEHGRAECFCDDARCLDLDNLPDSMIEPVAEWIFYDRKRIIGPTPYSDPDITWEQAVIFHDAIREEAAGLLRAGLSAVEQEEVT